jgi:hypothetical protein
MVRKCRLACGNYLLNDINRSIHPTSSLDRFLQSLGIFLVGFFPKYLQNGAAEFFCVQFPMGTTFAVPVQAILAATPGRSLAIGIATIGTPLLKDSKAVFMPE